MAMVLTPSPELNLFLPTETILETTPLVFGYEKQRDNIKEKPECKIESTLLNIANYNNLTLSSTSPTLQLPRIEINDSCVCQGDENIVDRPTISSNVFLLESATETQLAPLNPSNTMRNQHQSLSAESLYSKDVNTTKPPPTTRLTSSEENLTVQYSDSDDTCCYDLTAKRNTICIAETSGGRQQSMLLSKSMTHLDTDELHNAYHHPRCRQKTKSRIASLFSRHYHHHHNASHSENNSDNELPLIQQHITKARTPSLFRKFSKKAVYDHSRHELRTTNEINIHVPTVSFVNTDDSRGHFSLSKLNRSSLSFRSLSNNNNNNSTDNLEEHTSNNNHGLRVPHPKGFPILRSPFSRPKFEKDSAETRRQVYDEMLKCIQEDNCKRLKFLLKRRNTDINVTENISNNSKNNNNASLIHEAAFKGCSKCLKALLKAGWCIELVDASGWTPLHAAVYGQSLEAVRVLLSRGANANSLTADGLSPLHIAIYDEDLYMTHELFQYGVDPLLESQLVDITTPFQLAINLKRNLLLDYMLMQSCFLVEN